ncbi:MAG: beta-propeller domain-containing protein [Microthrixaceae bacterium]
MHRTPSTSSSSSIRLTPSVRAGRGTRRVASVATAVVATLVLGACTADWDPAQWDLELPAAASISELRRADDCDSLVDAARPMLASAVDSMWPDDDAGWFSGGSDAEDSSASPQEGLQRSAGGPASTVAPAPATAGGADGAATSDAGTDAGTVIGTNNQEQGVDEADLVKTDGRRLVSVVNGVLRVIELDGSPTIDGTLDLSPRWRDRSVPARRLGARARHQLRRCHVRRRHVRRHALRGGGHGRAGGRSPRDPRARHDGARHDRARDDRASDDGARRLHHDDGPGRDDQHHHAPPRARRCRSLARPSPWPRP